MDEGNSKRRRGLGLVTPNACTECRKKRTKCDGQVPCGRCASIKGIQCVYEVPVRQSKEDMRTEIERLKSQQTLNEQVLAALVSPDDAEQVLDQLRSGETLESITERLKSEKSTPSTGQLQSRSSVASSGPSATRFQGPYSESPHSDPRAGSWPEWGGDNSGGQSTHESVASEPMQWNPGVESNWQQQSSGHYQPSTAVMTPGGRHIFLGPGIYRGFQGPEFSEPWTNVTSDIDFVQHAMALYFCWEYPTFATLDQGTFLRDFQDGVPRYCSSLLVNAMLAVGCRCSTDYRALADTNDPTTAGDHFFAEAVRIFEKQQDHHQLTTIQALGLMSIREASRGHTSNSIYYCGQSIRLAIEMGLHHETEGENGEEESAERTVRRATFWGAFSLDQCWSLSIGKLPHNSATVALPPKPNIVQDIERAPWIPYADAGMSLRPETYDTQLTDDTGGTPEARSSLGPSYTQPSNVQSVYRTFCELSEIVHESLYTLYTPNEPTTGKSLLRVYTKYLRWYDAIPTVLRLGHNFTPSVLFSHMYYHYAILLLFRPFIKLDIVGSGVSPRDVCHQAAQAISTLLSSYNQLYTLRRTPSFVPFFILTSSITHLVAFGNRQGEAESLHQGMQDLRIMIECHGFAVRARQILAFLRNKWKIDISLDELPGDHGEDQEEVATATRPKTYSTNHWSLNVKPEDVVPSISPIRNPEEDPLFWLFPFQGRPLLEVGDMLEKSGFRILNEPS